MFISLFACAMFDRDTVCPNRVAVCDEMEYKFKQPYKFNVILFPLMTHYLPTANLFVILSLFVHLSKCLAFIRLRRSQMNVS